MHVALKVSPTFPETASEPKNPFGGGDATFNAGSESPQLFVDPTGSDHVLDLQSAFLGKGHVLDALLFGPFEIVQRSKAAIETGLARVTPVQVALTLQQGLELLTIRRVAFDQNRIQDQGRLSHTQIELMAKEAFAGAFFDNVGVFFKDGDDLFAGRNLLAQDHPTLGLLDHSPHQIQMVGQPFGQSLADGVLPLRGLLQCPGAVTQGPSSDLQEIPIMLFALLAPTVSDVQTTFFARLE